MKTKFTKLVIVSLGLFVLTGCAEITQINSNLKKTGETKVEDTATQKQITNEPQEENQDQPKTEQPIAQAVESAIQEPQKEANQIIELQPIQKLCKVIKVVDGDTITVDIDGAKETLRLIGINTPETVDPRKPVECFGKEASNKAKAVLNGRSVILENDPTQGERDKYDRLLRYIFLEDGVNFNKLMIAEGYAYEYTYSTPYKYQAEFKKAQQEAEQNKRGLWADNACVTDNSTPTIQTTPTPVPTPTATVCNCSGNTYNCPDFATQKQAQACYNYCLAQGKGDIHKLDRDNDEVVCESLP